ncbi:hypothetical protein GPECTOR_5g204 [Gonium pectorale]|uniref:Bifunctional inhibitor/plant lipid transfer protein/seed storage helical domain-containing protein n=1 Tax=Gonium pectorale TaxID=33097 RepID=A0A150GW72_GONPE|nr:hypothetical protein GPECTOR_5g204 [Gonium pectorale]|eukprot:KXZ54101.1 hypothetical protein GPECTOR_5g204 [Gonium pectorale]
MSPQRRSRSAAPCLLAALLLVSSAALCCRAEDLLASGARRGLRQAAQRVAAAAAGSPAIPTACINTGLDLQSSCTAELEIGSKALGLDPTADVSQIKVDIATLRNYLSKAPPPSAGCCSAAKAFNDAYCSCSPAVLDLVKSFTNNNIDQYREVARYLATRCKEVGTPFTAYIDNTCPKNKP